MTSNMGGCRKHNVLITTKKYSLAGIPIWRLISYACIVISICHGIRGANAAAVMSIDLGTEWMKVGVVSPGVPMEIALNRESKRKTPTILALRDGYRTFGEDAISVGIKDPAAAYGYLLDLLGKTIDNPVVDVYRKRFPYYNLIGDPERNTVIFKRSETEEYTVEELVSQMLSKAKEFAEASTGQPITECVITVPGYFGQSEREALLMAAHLSDLKVLQLINDYTAVALNYGVFNRANINETTQYYVFYDMGAYKTSAAVVSYQLVKDKQTKETNPVIQILGVGYDRTLGGLEIQLRLRDYLAAEFNAMKKTATDVTQKPKALAKLFKEAGRLKNVLSANADHYAQIENLLEDIDFKLQITREKLEELCSDLWPRVTKPLEDAIAASGINLDVISQTILFGGGTRVPKVQETLKQYVKQELGKSLNADEAAAMGAVYKAADLATGFKVKRFIVKDAVLFPIQVSFERDPGNGSGIKHNKRLLFGRMNSYPQKKVITFNKHTDDFSFYVHYGELNHLPEYEIANIGVLNITLVEVKKVKETLEKCQKEAVDSKGIKAYFFLDDSGLFRCTGAEYVYDKQVTEEEDEGTLAKLGSTISKLFSKEKVEEKKDGKEEADKKNQTTTETESETETPEKAAKEKGATSNEIPAENKSDDGGDGTKAKNATTTKIVTVKEPLKHSSNYLMPEPLSGPAFYKAFGRLDALNKAESERTRLESSFNALESHVIEIQQKLEETEYASCATDDEKQKILAECSAISNWLYDSDDESPKADIYEKRLKELKKLTNVFLLRHWEHDERPEALKHLSDLIESAEKFLGGAKNLTKEANPDKDVFTAVELETLEKVITETLAWKKTETEAQNKLKRSDDVKITVKDITDKMAVLDREVKYLVNKIKIWKPKVKPSTSKKDKKENKDAADNGEEAEEVQNEEDSSEGSKADKDDSQQEQVEEPQAAEELEAEEASTPNPTDKTTPRSDL